MKHILQDNKWHNYGWVYSGKTVRLYIDGKLFKGKLPMTIQYWFKGGAKVGLSELRISKCARRKFK